MDHQLFRNLTWNDLDDWVGSTILSRGKSYKTEVTNLASVKDNHLIATVHGSRTYQTEVWFDQEKLKSDCTCPYDWGIHCKHAVAVILVFLDKLKENESIPQADDSRLVGLHKVSTGANKATEANLGRFDDQKVRRALSKIKKGELVEWCAKLIVSQSDLEADLPGDINPKTLLPDRAKPTKQQIAQILARIRLETSCRYFESEWGYGDQDYGDLPDYDQFKEDFSILAEMGSADVLLQLATELLDLSTEQLNESDPPAETYEQLRDCMRIAGTALNSSDFSPALKVITVWEWQLLDEFDLLADAPRPENEISLSQDDWRLVANHFIRRLHEDPIHTDQENYIARYRRSRLLNRATEALESADAYSEVVQLMESELPHCQNHVELVDLLIQNMDFERAKHWIASGRREFRDSYPGIASDLLLRWQGIAIRQNDLALAASVAAYFFMQRCDLTNYELVREACQKLSKWDQIRPVLLEFLESGKFNPAEGNWSLPAIGLDDVDQPIEKPHHPRYPELIDIALAENRFDDAVDWFHKAPNHIVSGLDVEIAPKIQDSHPEVALEIWERNIHDLISQVKTKAYQAAMPYLKLMRELMTANDQVNRFERFVKSLRATHKNKRRLMQELDTLEHGNKKILD